MTNVFMNFDVMSNILFGFCRNVSDLKAVFYEIESHQQIIMMIPMSKTIKTYFRNSFQNSSILWLWKGWCDFHISSHFLPFLYFDCGPIPSIFLPCRPSKRCNMTHNPASRYLEEIDLVTWSWGPPESSSSVRKVLVRSFSGVTNFAQICPLRKSYPTF